MQKAILGYNSFLKNKIAHLKENEGEKEFQMSELEALVNSELSYMPLKMAEAAWNERSNWIDFEGNVSFLSGRFKSESMANEFTFKMGNIYGDFDCSGSDNLKNLIGGPKSCYDFNAQDCSLETLEGSPERTHNFNVSDNLLRDFKGCPKYVFGDFNLANNLIRSLDFGPLLITGTVTIQNGGRNLRLEKNGKSLIRLFCEMHGFLTKEYMTVGGSYEIKTARKVEADIENGDYVTRILVENPDYEIFLSNFKDKLKGNDHLKPLKDVGLF